MQVKQLAKEGKIRQEKKRKICFLYDLPDSMIHGTRVIFLYQFMYIKSPCDLLDWFI